MKVSEAKAAIVALQSAVAAAEDAGRDELVLNDIFAVDDEARAEQFDSLARAFAKEVGEDREVSGNDYTRATE